MLEEIYNQSKNSEHFFKHKNILFIGSESYDAPTITVLSGLVELGFNIYTVKKPNINSWFCNKIIENPEEIEFDFALSNLFWGTRWSYYKKYDLEKYLKVLIDGDDNLYWKTWRDKYDYYTKNCTFNPPEEIKNLNLMPFRWVEPLGDYSPDIVFTSQKQFDDKETFYLPFGIQKHYYDLFENKNTKEREYDFYHVPGVGIYRKRMDLLIRICRRFKIIPGNISTISEKSREIIPQEIRDNFLKDDNVHSYHRWVMSAPYFQRLNNSKVLIYPGIDYEPMWESKRPWEAYASGCLVIMRRPYTDVSEYPITEICEYAVYDSYFDFIKKCRYISKNPEFLDKMRKESFEKAKKYFSEKPIANYFLKVINDNRIVKK